MDVDSQDKKNLKDKKVFTQDLSIIVFDNQEIANFFEISAYIDIFCWVFFFKK
jgi:hypothetical protein